MAAVFPSPSKASPTRPSHLRQINTRGLLQLVRTHSPCSRADLVRYSGLTAPTVASAIAYLESMNLVESLGDGESSGGRPPELIAFNATHGFVAGADVGGTRLRMMLADLNGNSAAQWSMQLSAKQKTPAAVCTLIHEGLLELCRLANTSISKVVHLTVGAPGITDVERGTVLSAPNLTQWNQVPLRSLLQDATGIDTLVENDTNLAAVGEHWQGSARNTDNFVFIAMGTGVGAGIYLGGRLHHGSEWSAGEIGYLSVAGQPYESVRMRDNGQLERAIGGAGIERHWLQTLKSDIRQHDAALARLRAPHIFDLAQEGDPLALKVLTYTAEILAGVIATIALLFNPSLIVLGGGVGSHECLCRATESFVARSDFARPQLKSSSLGTQAQLFGAIALSLSAVEAKLIF